MDRSPRTASPLAGLDLFHTLLELGPIFHDALRAQIRQTGGNFVPLVLFVAAHVGDDRHSGTDGAEGSALAIFDSDHLVGFTVEGGKGVEIDSRIRFGGRFSQGSSSAENMIRIEEFILTDFLDGGLDTTQSRRRDNSQTIFLRFEEFFQFGVGALARLGFFIQLANHLILFLLDVGFEFLAGQFELVLGLQRDHHTAEILADEVLDQLLAGVAIAEAALFEDLVC